jgi:hypothetical protein
VTTSTYAPPFLQSPVGQQVVPGQQPSYGPLAQPFGPDQFQQFGLGQQPFGQQPFGVSPGGQFLGVEQIIPSIQVIVQLLGNAQQCLWTAQHVTAQLPGYLATTLQQQYHQQGQPRQFQRPYSMSW